MVRKFLEDIFRRKLDVLHSARVVHTLYQQQKQGRYCDLKVLVEDQQYFVHRCVLASASAQLDSQINGLDTIQLVGVTNYGFEHLLEILYSGKMAKVATVDSARFHQIVSAADALNAESMTNPMDYHSIGNDSFNSLDDLIDVYNVIEYCARERSDLMKVVLDQSSGPEKTSSDNATPTTNITEVSVAETLAVDSPAGGEVVSSDPVSGEPSPFQSTLAIEPSPLQPTMTDDDPTLLQSAMTDEPSPMLGSEVFQTEQIEVKPLSSDPTNEEQDASDWTMKIKQEPGGPPPILDLEQGLVAGIETVGDDIESTSDLTGPYSSNLISDDLPTFSHNVTGHGSIAEKIQSSRAAMFSAGSLGLKRLKCGICKRMFTSPQHLKVHMKKHAGVGMKPFRCDLCGMKFSFQTTLIGHMKMHDVKKYICKICGRDFKLPRNYRAHMENVHAEFKPQPRESEYSFPGSIATKPSMMSGSSRRKTQPVKRAVESQDETGANPGSLGDQQPHSSNFSPNIKSGTDLDQWKDAMEHVERGIDGKFSCPMCEKGFSRRWNLKCHILTHSENRVSRPRPKFSPKKVTPYQCTDCGKSFGNASNLEKHVRLIHPYSKSMFGYNTGNTQVSKMMDQMTQDQAAMCWCKICGRGFRRMRNLRSHMETHSGTGYECHICGRTFAQRDGLNGHLWIHGGLNGPKNNPANPPS